MQRQTQLANDIWPLLLPRIQAMITASASGSGAAAARSTWQRTTSAARCTRARCATTGRRSSSCWTARGRWPAAWLWMRA